MKEMFQNLISMSMGAHRVGRLMTANVGVAARLIWPGRRGVCRMEEEGVVEMQWL